MQYFEAYVKRLIIRKYFGFNIIEVYTTTTDDNYNKQRAKKQMSALGKRCVTMSDCGIIASWCIILKL